MAASPRYDIRFCTSGDGARIAYAALGRGPAIVKSANWMTHLDLDRDSPLWRHWLRELSSGRRLVAYDGRGYGLSDRRPPSLTLPAMVDDLRAVSDAAGVERGPLLGFCHGGPIAIAYAARHPERVSALVLCGTYAQGRARREHTERDRAERELQLRIIELGWAQDSAAYRQVFTSKAVPRASAEVFDYVNRLQRESASVEAAMALYRTVWDFDVGELLPRVRCPTLVLHATGDAVVPFEQGRLLAREIAGARLVPLDSDNHDLLEDEPAWSVLLREVRAFLASTSRPATAAPLPTLAELTEREREVLELIAQGLDNDEIAARLHRSEKTVRNHVSSIFGKLRLTSRARVIVRAREAGFGGPAGR